MSPVCPPIALIRPTSADDWHQWQAFRWNMLRAPWLPDQAPEIATGLPPAGEYWMARSQQSELIACGQLLWLPGGHAQLRNMAVAPDQRGQGVGGALLNKLESMARGHGCHRMVAQARDTALAFYRRHGYAISGPSDKLFGQIPHSWVEKPLNCNEFGAFGLRRQAASDDDRQRLSSFIFAVLAEYGLAPEHDGIDQDLLAPHSTYQGGFFDLLLDQHDQIQGSVALLPVSPQQAELRRMYLAPEWRGRGLGRACLGHALQRARALSFGQISLETATVLEEARGLYSWAGFQPDAGPMHARRCDQRLVLTLD